MRRRAMPRNRERADSLKLRLADAPEGQEVPKLAVFAVDRAGETVHRAEVTAQGEAKIPAAALDKAEQVIVASADAKEPSAAEEQLTCHAAHVRDVISQG